MTDQRLEHFEPVWRRRSSTTPQSHTVLLTQSARALSDVRVNNLLDSLRLGYQNAFSFDFVFYVSSDVDTQVRPYHRMSQTVKTFLLMWLAFGAFMGAFFTFQYGPRIGVPSGLASGLLFAGLMSAFGHYQASKFKGQCSLAEDETLLKDGAANHFVRAEGVGGWLYLTSSRLHFRSHKINIQKHELSIPLDHIVTVKTSLTLGIIPNGLTVETPDKAEKFVVQGARAWVEAIGQAKPTKA